MVVKSNIKKGQMVYKKQLSGETIGKVDENWLFMVRSIGPRQATLVQVDKKTGAPLFRGRGHNVYIQTEEEAKRMNTMSNQSVWQHFYAWEWGQVLAPIGEAGWDADFNW